MKPVRAIGEQVIYSYESSIQTVVYRSVLCSGSRQGRSGTEDLGGLLSAATKSWVSIGSQAWNKANPL